MGPETVQLTKRGAERFWEIVGVNASPQAIYQRNRLDRYPIGAMMNLVWLHPLSYPWGNHLYEMAKKATEEDYRRLIEEGLAIHVDNAFEHMMGILDEYQERNLMHVFETYRQVVRQEDWVESDVRLAIDMLTQSVQEDNETLAIQDSPHSLKSRSDQVIRTLTCQGKVSWDVVLDSLIQEIHFDPDLLRHHSQTDQMIVTGAIVRWLDHLSGDPSKKRWSHIRDMWDDPEDEE